MTERVKLTRKKKAAILVALLAFASVSLYVTLVKSLNGPRNSDAPWRTVGASLQEDFSTIQAAIYSPDVLPGWGIVVLPSYDPSYGESFPIEVNKTVTLMAKEAPTLDADDADSAFHVTADGVTIEGFKVENALYGIFLDCVQNCKIKYNTVEKSSEGIRLKYSHDNLIEGNVLEKNGDRAIYLSYSVDNTIKGNEVANNNNGLQIEMSDGNIIQDNTLEKNSHSISLNIAHGNWIVGNIIKKEETWASISLLGSRGNTIKTNTIEDPKVETGGSGISLRNSDGNTVEENWIKKGGIGIGTMDSNQNLLKGNRIREGTLGIRLLRSNHTVIKENTVTHCGPGEDGWAGGIVLAWSWYNKVLDNQASFNFGAPPGTPANGIQLKFDSEYNLIDGNVACHNEACGISLHGLSEVHNTITNNVALHNGDHDLCGTLIQPNTWANNYYDTWA